MFRAIAEFLTFRRMIGPFLLQILFWIVVALFVLFGLREIQSGDRLVGWGVIIVGTLGLRLVMELVLIAFRMYDRLGDIRRLLVAVDEATRPIASVDEDG